MFSANFSSPGAYNNNGGSPPLSNATLAAYDPWTAVGASLEARFDCGNATLRAAVAASLLASLNAALGAAPGQVSGAG